MIPVYNKTDMTKLPKGLYVGFFHGRDNPEDQLEDWGFDGPVVGPLKFWHTTYLSHQRGEFQDGFGKEYVESGIADDHSYTKNCTTGPKQVFAADFEIGIVDDLAVVGGKYYGDWTVFYNEEGI